MTGDTPQTAEVHQKLRGFFITGTDTDVGKTYVASCIARTLTQQGKNITPRKPIASGAIRQADGTLVSEDARLLKQACQSTESIETICPFQFEQALSPQTAIELNNQFITTCDLVNACAFNPEELYLVEGAGGFYSPISSDGLNKDLAQQLGLPVVIVVMNKLGCINQTLLTIEAVKNAGLTPHSIVLNCADKTNFYEGISEWVELPIFSVNYAQDQQLQIIENFA